MDSADPTTSPSNDPLTSSSPSAKPVARVAVKPQPEHRVRAATLRTASRRASSEPPTTVFEERPTIPMWGGLISGTLAAEPKADTKPAPAPSRAPAATPAPAAVLAVGSAPVASAAEPAAVTVKPTTPTPTPRARPAKLDAPAFGAGMLQARKVRTKKDPAETQRIRELPAGPMFGASVLHAQKSSGRWVALVLALAAIVAVILAVAL